MSNGAFPRLLAKKKDWALDPGLLKAIVSVIPKGRSIVELGAGVGTYLTALREFYEVVDGFDGIRGVDELTDGLVSEADLTDAYFLDLVSHADDRPHFDWAFCIEVGEHIPEEKIKSFLHNITHVSNEGLIISWAIPGQRGWDHVSCRSPEWVTEEVCKRGWSLDQEKTAQAREIAGRGIIKRKPTRARLRAQKRNGWHNKLLVFTRGEERDNPTPTTSRQVD